MSQKWDYKIVLRDTGWGQARFEIDGKPAMPPKAMIDLLKALGQEGWELAALSTFVLPSPVESMSDAERVSVPMVDENSHVHPLRQPSVTYWWIFKRPLSPCSD
jgi:hypothetical protein